ncbi:MAG: carbonic anhydrase [archaeon]|nr:carbonic anhydrase [archaeon]
MVLSTVGQRPDTMIIGCCDSRAAPEIIFDAAPGELFVVRNVANLVPPFECDGHFHGTSAAIEFGLKSLRLRHLLVLGHGKCGGIDGHLNGAGKQSDFLGQWLKLIDPAAEALRKARVIDHDSCAHSHPASPTQPLVTYEVSIHSDHTGLLAKITSVISSSGCNIVNADIGPAQNRFTIGFKELDWNAVHALRESISSLEGVGKVHALIPDFESKKDRQMALELKAIEFSIKNLRTFPIVSDLERINELTLHGAWFDIATGQLLTFDPTESRWQDQN